MLHVISKVGPIQQFFESGVVNRLRQEWLRVPQATFDGDAKLSLSYENVLFPFLGRFSVHLYLIICSFYYLKFQEYIVYQTDMN